MDTITLTSFDLTKLNSATLYNYTIPLPEGCENLSGVTTATFRASFKRPHFRRTDDDKLLSAQ